MEQNHELILALGRVEGKIDAFAQSQIRHEGILEDHSKRIVSLEKWQSKVLGMAAVVGAMASAAVQYLFRS